MSPRIRLCFRRPGLPPFDTAVHEGFFHGSSPMRHQGRSCGALLANPLLSGPSARQAAGADFLLGCARGDPDDILFIKGSPPSPCALLWPFPDCSDWIFDHASLLWLGACRDASGSRFEAPLFALWLLQALWVAGPAPLPARPPASFSGLGRKNPVAARADLLWDWRSAREPRLELFGVAHQLSLSPCDPSLGRALGRLCHPALAPSFASLPPERFAWLAGTDPALSCLLASHELLLATHGAGLHPPRPLRL